MIDALKAWLRFYAKAVTRYQLHAPLAFALEEALLRDPRTYYAYDRIERLRAMLREDYHEIEFLDYGAGPRSSALNGKTSGKRSVAEIARRSASTAGQGRMLFRLTQFVRPDTILELGSSLGFGSAFLRAAAPKAQFISLEGNAACVDIARRNLELLELPAVDFRVGPFEATLEKALRDLPSLDLAFIDGNHRLEPTLRYFEACLPLARNHSIFVFDDIYWSDEMQSAWQQIKAHPRVRLSLDCWDFGLIAFDSAVLHPQHYSLVPTWMKPWKAFAGW